MVLNEGALDGASVACCSGFGQGKGTADRLLQDVHVLVHKAAQALVDEQSHRRLVCSVSGVTRRVGRGRCEGELEEEKRGRLRGSLQ